MLNPKQLTYPAGSSSIDDTRDIGREHTPTEQERYQAETWQSQSFVGFIPSLRFSVSHANLTRDAQKNIVPELTWPSRSGPIQYPALMTRVSSLLQAGARWFHVSGVGRQVGRVVLREFVSSTGSAVGDTSCSHHLLLVDRLLLSGNLSTFVQTPTTTTSLAIPLSDVFSRLEACNQDKKVRECSGLGSLVDNG